MIIMQNILSFDIEEWFHPEIFNGRFSPENPSNFPATVERNVDKILAILQKSNSEATFFILGWVAENYPKLISAIEAEGHEIASHGYSHRMITQMEPEEFEQDLERSLTILNSIVRKPVVGFRAPTFSIVESTRWALPIMSRLGIQYDSSVFPIYHDRYGMPDSPRHPYIIYENLGKRIVEFPMTTVNFFGMRFPVGGGGYLRLYPFSLTKLFLGRSQKRNQQIIFYAHPWEFDENLPRVGLSFLSTLRHYSGIKKMDQRLQFLLQNFSFTSFKNCLAENPVFDHYLP